MIKMIIGLMFFFFFYRWQAWRAFTGRLSANVPFSGTRNKKHVMVCVRVFFYNSRQFKAESLLYQ
jgi:hypothetical protein